MSDAPSITREIFISAPVEDVFPYLTESTKYLLWMGVNAELDARPGGIFKIDPNGRDVIFGEFVEVVRPYRVVFTWGWNEPDHPMPAGSSRVEIDLVRENNGTRLRLAHFAVAEPLRERHSEGWRHYLDRLSQAVVGIDPGPDPYGRPEHRHV